MCPLSSVTAEPCAGPSVFCGFPLLCEAHRTRSHNLCLFDSLKWSHLLVFFHSLETRKETGVQVTGNASRAPRSCRLAKCCLQPARVPAREIRAKRMSQDVPRGTHNTDAHCTVRPNLNLTNCFSPDERTNDTRSLAYSSSIFVWVAKGSPGSKLDSYYRSVCRAVRLAGRKCDSRGLTGMSSV